MKGKVKFLRKERGFGFVKREDEPDLFFHFKDFNDRNDTIEIELGNELEFEMGEYDGKQKAVKINVIRES